MMPQAGPAGTIKFIVTFAGKSLVTGGTRELMCANSPDGTVVNATFIEIALGGFLTQWVTPIACTVKAMAIACDVAPGAAQTQTATLWVNGSSTAATVANSGASQTHNASTPNLALSAGDTLMIAVTLSGSAAGMYAIVTLELEV